MDNRWAFVSTSVTFFVAGSIAWLAAATSPPAAPQWYRATAGRSLVPYQLFTRLASQGTAAGARYAAIGPSAALAVGRLADKLQSPSALDQATLSEDDADQSATPDNNNRTITMDTGDTLTGVLTDAGVSSADANAVVTALRKVYDPRSVRVGQSFDLSFGPVVQKPVARIIYTSPVDGAAGDDPAQDSIGRLLSVSFSPSIEHEITVTRAADGSFTAQDVKKDLVARYHRAGARIDSSLYLAAMQAGIPADVVVQMIHIFSYQVDFQRDIHPGNSFEVLYNYYYTPDGKPAKQGVIEYASMKLDGRTVALYRYEAKNGDGVDYLDAKGRSAKSLLMKTPVDGARISSGFGMRFRPCAGLYADAQGRGFRRAGRHACDGRRFRHHQVRRP
jgi:murein DD-endopeptidase MepM/ murein hydrolase activator NlpD